MQIRYVAACVLAAGLSASSLTNGAVSYHIVDLGTLGGDSSFPNAPLSLNSSGWVTGFSQTSGNAAMHAFLWNGAMQDLGTLGGTESKGLAINASGQVAGNDITANVQHAFLWNGTSMQDLGTLGGTDSVANAINANGWVTGDSGTVGEHEHHVFLWDGTTLQDLGTLGGPDSEGLAINDNGWVTGNSELADGTARAFLWDGTTMQDLGTLGGCCSTANAINANGWVTGGSTNAGDATQQPYVWNGITMQGLGTLGGFTGFGRAINASGWVTGDSYIADNSGEHAFLWNGTTMQDLGSLGRTRSHGLAINASGQVVGFVDSTLQMDHAFVWNGSSMIDLNTFLPAGSPYVLTRAYAINDAGQIVVRAQASDKVRAFLLTPFFKFDFNGFFAPVDNPPATNVLKAGQAVPVKFGLGGNQGLDIFAPGYPASQNVSCATLGSPDVIEETVAAGASGLQYNAATDQYSYVWKTVGTWANTCRVLILKFTDGAEYTANFQFKK